MGGRGAGIYSLFAIVVALLSCPKEKKITSGCEVFLDRRFGVRASESLICLRFPRLRLKTLKAPQSKRIKVNLKGPENTTPCFFFFFLSLPFPLRCMREGKRITINALIPGGGREEAQEKVTSWSFSLSRSHSHCNK